MAKAIKKSPKEASNIFHNIMKASVKGNPAPSPKKQQLKRNNMELRTRYKIFKIVREGGGFPGPKTVMRPIRDGANTFDGEHDAIQWIQEREPQERYTEFVVLTTYSME